MAGDFPNLPIEIVLHIIKCEDSNRSRRYLCEALRLTCKELDAKTRRYYGKGYYKKLYVPLNESGLKRLLHISQGQLGYHVQSITIDCDPLLSQRDLNCSSLSSGFEGKKRDWWDGDSDESLGDVFYLSISFDDRTMDLLRFGECADLLGRSLSRLPDL